MFANPPEAELRRILTDCRRLAVVGLSPNPGRPSFQVSRAMQRLGYTIIPVRPAVAEVLGEPAYPRLEEVPGAVDLVVVFRNPSQIGPVVDACIARGFARLWLQDGVVNPPEARRAAAAGIQVVMDRCVWRDAVQLLT
jgi:predicted CoA-binding protein